MLRQFLCQGQIRIPASSREWEWEWEKEEEELPQSFSQGKFLRLLFFRPPRCGVSEAFPFSFPRQILKGSSGRELGGIKYWL